MNTWAIVVRVSHMGARQTGASDFHSERDQIAAAVAAVPEGDRPDILPSELDVSGGTPLRDRPSLLAAVEGVESGKYVGIIVAYHSRLGREVEEEEAVWRRVEAAGGRIVMALDGLDTATVDGRMVRRIRSSINAAERERHAEKFENLREWATAAGIWQRRQIPRGYVKDPETRTLTPGPDAVQVARLFERRGAGASISELAREIGMTPGGVRALLRNRLYLGELTVGSHTNPAAHPPLVTEDVWQAAQLSVPRPPRAVEAGPALLAGLVRCGSCSHVMSRGQTKRIVYSCAAAKSTGRCPQPAGITAALLDAHVESVALPVLEVLSARASVGSDAVDEARQALAAAKAELRAFVLAVSAADIGEEAFTAGATQRRDVVRAAEEKLHAEMARRPVAPLSGPMTDVWDRLGVGERNTVLRGLIEAVIVWPAGRGGAPAVAGRTVVLRHGAGMFSDYRGGGRPIPVQGVTREDIDDELVLRVPGLEDAFEGAGG
jgi:DNA invertase Pin-like site-specific DNA recombinase